MLLTATREDDEVTIQRIAYELHRDRAVPVVRSMRTEPGDGEVNEQVSNRLPDCDRQIADSHGA